MKYKIKYNMPTKDQQTKYRCGICNDTKWGQKSHLTSHKKTKTHKARIEILKLNIEKLTREEMKKEYNGETDITNIIKKLVDVIQTNRKEQYLFKRYNRSNNIVYQHSFDEQKEVSQEEEFKSVFMSQLNKWHNLLRGCSVTGEDALDDILYCLFLCYLSPKVSTEGDFDLANSEKSCYKRIIQKKVKDWISKLNIDYLINNTAELVTTKEEDSSIYKCGELMSRHPMTKGLIKNKSFINCKNKLILSKLLKECRDFSTSHNIFNKIDIIGIAWEYFNTKHGGNGGTSKERGQYFTERPVMGMCCQLIEKSHIEEMGINNESTLGDEFCATFGFPLYAKKFLNQKFDISIQDKKMYGVEFADRLSRFGIMNAMFSLTNFKHIRSGDSFVTNVSPHLDFSVHNVPFGKSMNCKNIKESYNSEREKEDSPLPEFKDVVPIEKNGDAMLSCQVVLYKTKKMGLVIIKDGEETTGSSNKKWREWFCDSCVIHKIMKIPTGAFSHTGTKTVCIYFTKRNGKNTEKIQFLEMSDTGDKITEICEVTRDDLQQNNYSWDPNVYIVDEEMEKLMASSGCEWKKLGDIVKFKSKSKRPALYGKKNGKYPFFRSSMKINSFVDTPDFNEESLIIGDGGSPNVNYGTEFSTTDHCFVFNSGILNNKYIYYYIKNNLNLLNKYYTGGGLCNMSKTSLSKLDIPIPSQETQTQVVQTLDDLANHRQHYMAIRDGLERRMKYYFEMMIKRHREEITMEKLGDVCDIKGGKSLKKSEYNEGIYPVIGGGKEPTGYHNEFNCDKNIILMSGIGSYSGFIKKYNIETWVNGHNNCFKLLIKNLSFSNNYLYYYLKFIQNNIYKLQHGGGQGQVQTKDIIHLKIPKLNLELQAQIVQYLDNLEAEKNKITETLHRLDTEMREILTQSYQSGDTQTIVDHF